MAEEALLAAKAARAAEEAEREAALNLEKEATRRVEEALRKQAAKDLAELQAAEENA